MVSATLYDAIYKLSTVCDGAYAEDGQGFSQADAATGHRLASIPRDAWSRDMEAVAFDLVRKYRGQLEGFGFNMDLLKPPAETQVKGRARDAVKAVTVEGDRFVIQFAYNPSLVQAVKAIPGRRFDARRKVWTAPLSAQDDVLSLARDHGFGVAPQVSEVVVPAAAEQKKAKDRHITTEGRRFVLSFDYNPALVAAVKNIPGRKWDGERKVWTVGVDAALSVAKFADEYSFSLDPQAVAAVEAAQERVEASKAADADLDQRGALELRPYQKGGVKYIMDHANGRGIIGDEMGLGKTPQAIEIVLQSEVSEDEPAVIIVPPSLRRNWQKEFAKFAPNVSTHIIEGRTPYALPEAEVYIIGYSTIHDWADVLPVPKVMVCDESHYLSNSKMKKVRA